MVLLTGATGFIGRHAAGPLLAHGFEVHRVARQFRDGAAAGVVDHRADLLDRAARRALLREMRPTHLVHLAWYVEHGRFWSAAENELWLEASADFLATFAAEGGRRAVVTGSCAEYDWALDPGRPWREDDPCRPSTAYGQAKYALLRRSMDVAAETGLSLAWARLFLLFGPGEDERRLVPSICRALLAGEEARCTSGRQIRDFLDTRDVAAALAALAADETVTGAVNVASGIATSVADLARLLGRLAGRPELIRLGALPDRADEPPALVADVGRLRREAGFSPELTQEERLADCLDWWRRQA